MDKEHVFFENYAKHWDRDRKENRTILSEFLRLMALETGAAVLDAGCGTGVLLPYLAEAVGADGAVEGFDYSQQMIDVAKDKFASWANVTSRSGGAVGGT